MRPRALAAAPVIALALAACGDAEGPKVDDTVEQAFAEKEAEEACRTEVKIVATAAEAYYAVEGRYPIDLDALEGEFLEDVDTLEYVVGLEDEVPVLADDAPC